MQERNEGEPNKKTVFRNVYVDGCKYFIFVHGTTDHLNVILWAVDDTSESHSYLVEQAEIDEIVNESFQPKGGGVFDAKTGNFIRPSIHYGNVEDRIFDLISDKLPDLVNCD
jgi:hypothetical protein